MQTLRRVVTVVGVVLAALSLSLCAYLTAYYAMLDGQLIVTYDHDRGEVLLEEPNDPHYRIHNRFVTTFFLPAHQFDYYLVRPKPWELASPEWDVDF